MALQWAAACRRLLPPPPTSPCRAAVLQGGLFADASALAVVAGSVTEAIAYTKTASLHLWLLGYEFTGAAAAEAVAGEEAPCSTPLPWC